MPQYKQFIDNSRIQLSDALREIAPHHNKLSIATGYWDIGGTLEIINEIKDYDNVRLLIGKEPLTHRLQQKYHINPDDLENLFPNSDIKHDLEYSSTDKELEDLRRTVKIMVTMMEEGRLNVRIFRKPRLHAKAYIFGELGLGNSVGIIGSSNFTKAGLTSNTELNFLTDEYKIVEFVPQTEKQENGHLTWFKDLWESEDAIDWTGDFSEILVDSPLGDKTYGAYDVYIKTLMDLFPDELIDPTPFTDDVVEYLHPFQNQNALALRRKLYTNGVAMLSDSVGLGKTVTASAIIDHFIKEGQENIVLILPAALKQQWIDELTHYPWNLIYNRDFRIVTQQNISELNELMEVSENRIGTKNEIDLFVIDEAHNLRNQNSERYQAVLELLQQNPSSQVLLLTATPINNSLMDFAYQIQLGAKGELVSRNVYYRSKTSNKSEKIDFFEALRRIQSEATRAEKNGNSFDWDYHKQTLVSGLRHYLVRSTRQGVEHRQAMKGSKIDKQLFPKSNVTQINYKYTSEQRKFINQSLIQHINESFEGIDPRGINIDLISRITQINSHPIDMIKQLSKMQRNHQYEQIINHYNINEDIAMVPIVHNDSQDISIIPTLYKLINLLGFTPYRLDTYHYDFYNKSIETIRHLDLNSNYSRKIQMQMSIHNMLQVTWLKRLESSTATLLKSVQNYIKRINLFEKWLKQGYLVNLSDAMILESEYGDSIETAFEDYNQYLKDLDYAVQQGKEQEIKKQGIERKVADPTVYNLNQLNIDIHRDKQIADVICKILEYLSAENQDKKIEAFVNSIVEIINNKQYGDKVLIFSFFSDTIEYLKNNLSKIISNRIKDFEERSLFISGGNGNTKRAAQLFSPKSQKYKLKYGEKEIDFLFATDVLSEGQNLQDAGILINYDLHWNPVRMIQRNGRINRLGSEYREILVANARPHDELEIYLKLVRRLENKINAISHTVGTDQSILGEKENPIEFTEIIEESFGIYDTNNNIATEAMQNLESENDVMDWVDNYSLELREFIDDHKKVSNEIERIQSIPLGKWNYLPKNKQQYSLTNEVIGLYTADGETNISNDKIKESAFIRIAPSAMKRGPFATITTEYLSEEEALERIKTTPDNNKRLLDQIEIDRETYIEKGKEEVNTYFQTSQDLYKVTPARSRALDYLSIYFEGVPILDIIRKGIRLSNDKKEFESIARIVNKEMKEYNRLNLSTINRFNNLLDRLNIIEQNETHINGVRGVLFYANPE